MALAIAMISALPPPAIATSAPRPSPSTQRDARDLAATGAQAAAAADVAIDLLHVPAPGIDATGAGEGWQDAPCQARMDAALRALGYCSGGDWRSRVFDGAAHDEAAWRSRVEIPLSFLLAPAE